jgi:cyclase
MPLATRVIPALLCRGRQLVKGKAFDSWRSVGHAAQAVRIHQARGVDELVLLDIAATAEGRGPDLDLVRELSDACFMPLAVGGGVRTVADVRALLAAGADKVVVCTAALESTTMMREVSDAVGCQAIVAAIDVRQDPKHGRYVTVRSGTHVPITTRRSNAPHEIARLLQGYGAGEILLTSVDREGAMQGYDLELIHAVSRSVTVPVIAHGGAGTYEHMLEAIEAGASAVAAGSMFLFTDQTPAGAARYLASHGVEARI